MILTREDLLQPRKLAVKEIDVDGLGALRIRQLNHSEAVKWKRWQSSQSDESMHDLKLVQLCVVDEFDEPILTDDDITELANQPGTLIALLVYEVMVVNGFMREVEPDEALELFSRSPERLFLCRLAAKFGVPNVDVFADSLTDEQLKEWKAVALLDGWYQDPEWTNAAELLSTELAAPKGLTPQAAEQILAGRQ